MKNNSFLFIIIISTTFFSCKNEKKSIFYKEHKSKTHDSVKVNFKVLENDNRRKEINSFFQKKNTRNQFNGNILFAENGNIIETTILPFSLSYDHRVINGADAGNFMNYIKSTIEKGL